MQIVDSQVHIWESGNPGGSHTGGSHTAHDALVGMDAAGVDACIVIPPPWDPNADRIALEAAARDPDRFAVMGQVALTAPADPSATSATWTTDGGMLGIRLAFSQPQHRTVLASGEADWIWPLAECAQVPIMLFAPGSLPIVARVAEQHPSLKLCIDHMGLSTGTAGSEAFAPVLPDLRSLARHPNVAIKMTSAPAYSRCQYPYRDISDYLQGIVDAFGPERCFWGTDITRLSCSWRSCVTHFTEDLPWLTGEAKELVMGRALCTWLGWRCAAT